MKQRSNTRPVESVYSHRANQQYELFEQVAKAKQNVSQSEDYRVDMVAAELVGRNAVQNKVRVSDSSIHEWYRFVLSFPPHLVCDYLEKFGVKGGKTVLDPFCGTGTTLVECKKLGIESIGIEANPMAYFASSVKTNWSVHPEELRTHAKRIADDVEHSLSRPEINGSLSLRSLDPDSEKLILRNSISPLPLHKTLILLDRISNSRNSDFIAHERLALAKTVVHSVSNLHFGPEVGVGKPKEDSDVVLPWFENVCRMVKDLQLHRNSTTSTTVHLADSRSMTNLIPANSIDAVITSPPYPNEKDYTRTTRLESVLLGFIKNKDELRQLKKGLVRSNTRNVYKADDDDLLVSDNPQIQDIATEIERRRQQLGKTSGFERLYARVTKLYFGGMQRHLSDLRAVLRPGANLAYVVGDQASYLRVMIRTGELLAGIAQALGYEVKGIDLFRTRLATATREQLREEVVLLKWRG